MPQPFTMSLDANDAGEIRHEGRDMVDGGPLLSRAAAEPNVPAAAAIPHPPLSTRQRWAWTGYSLRRRLRDAYFHWIRKTASTDDLRRIATETLRGQLRGRASLDVAKVQVEAQPFEDLGTCEGTPSTALRDDIVIITARFRSGSTFLWNLFRETEGCTAFYEPFNERRWFDPQRRGNGTDATHRQVTDYWREYEGLQSLGDLYREDWIRRDLWMDADSWDPAMQRYVERLVESARGRPILQFNRIDFRLPWFRKTFPNARLVHLYRHPREQWCSSLMKMECFPRTGRMEDFEPHDKFYLRNWASDLKYQFPFLDEREIQHPYALFYYLWKLSYLYGRVHSDYSVSYERLMEAPGVEISRLFDYLEIDSLDLDRVLSLVSKPRQEKWREYASHEWFARIESECEKTLAAFFA